jgi:hypothetical protein
MLMDNALLQKQMRFANTKMHAARGDSISSFAIYYRAGYSVVKYSDVSSFDQLLILLP